MTRVTVNGREYDAETRVGTEFAGMGDVHRAEVGSPRAECGQDFLADRFLLKEQPDGPFCRRCFPAGGTP